MSSEETKVKNSSSTNHRKRDRSPSLLITAHLPSTRTTVDLETSQPSSSSSLIHERPSSASIVNQSSTRMNHLIHRFTHPHPTYPHHHQPELIPTSSSSIPLPPPPPPPASTLLSKYPSYPFSSFANLLSPSDPIPSTPNVIHPSSPPRKRRKGVAGTILSTAIDAALFTSAIGYAAYQFWCGKSFEEEEKTLSLKSSSPKSIPNPANNLNLFHPSSSSSPPPPPYEPRIEALESDTTPPISQHQTQTPIRSTSSLSNRSTLRLHPTRQTRSHRTNTCSDSINFILRPRNPIDLTQFQSNRSSPPSSSARIGHDDDSDLMSDFVSSLNLTSYPTRSTQQPAIEPNEEAEDDEDEDQDDDEELKAFQAQIQGLIKEGQAALASRPTPPPSIRQPKARHHHRSILFPSLDDHPPSRPSSLLLIPSSSSDDAPSSIRSTQSLRSHHHPDQNVQLLQQALERAARVSRTNWWEQPLQRAPPSK